MGIGTGLAVATTAIGAGTSIYGAKKASSAAQSQVDAANHAADLQKQAADEALAFQKQQYADTQAREAPWLASGTDALSKLSQLPQFQAPGADFTQDPGYAFRVAQGNKAIQNSAAAKGAVLNPATAKALDQFNQDTASAEYQNVYNRRYQEYMNNLNQLQSRAGIGQTAVSGLNSSGSSTANAVSGILNTSATNIGQDVQSAGAARASGYVGSANALSGLNNTMGNINQIYTLSQLLKSQKKAPVGTLYDDTTGMGTDYNPFAISV